MCNIDWKAYTPRWVIAHPRPFFFVPTPGCFKPIRWLSSKRWHIKFHPDPHSNFSSCMIFNSIISWDLEFLGDRATQCAGSPPVLSSTHCDVMVLANGIGKKGIEGNLWRISGLVRPSRVNGALCDQKLLKSWG